MGYWNDVLIDARWRNHYDNLFNQGVPMKNLVIIATLLVPAYACAGKLDLKQDLSGLDLVVAMSPKNNPSLIKITNKSGKVVACKGDFTGADASSPQTVTIKPGKSAVIRVPGTYTDLPREAHLACMEKQSSTQK
jgi:hypothetical protein